MAGLEDLSPEIMLLILEKLPAKTLLNLSECNRYLHTECLGNSQLWRELCRQDFDVDLQTWHPFSSCHEVYQLIYKARIILEETSNTTISGMPPDWMFAWCTLGKQPQRYTHNRLAKGKAKKLWNLKEEQLPILSHSFGNTFYWKDCYEAAIRKHGSVSKFQGHTLGRCARSQKRVISMYPESSKTKRKRYYLKYYRSDSEEYNPIIKQALMKQNKPDCTMTIDSFEAQRIGDDFISGKLHRFGRSQLAEYTKFTQALYQEAINMPCCLSINDIISCVLLTYEKIGDDICKHLYTKDEFLAIARIYKSRVSLVWDWQIEKGLDYQIEYRGSLKVKQLQAYNDFIANGHMRDFQKLRTRLEGLENISIWSTENAMVTGLLNDSVRAVLQGKKLSEPTLEAKSVSSKMERYLSSGNDEHFRSLLKTVSDLVRSYLNDCFVYLRRVDKQLDDSSVSISAVIGQTRKRQRSCEETEDGSGPSSCRRTKDGSSLQDDCTCRERHEGRCGGPPAALLDQFVDLLTSEEKLKANR